MYMSRTRNVPDGSHLYLLLQGVCCDIGVYFRLSAKHRPEFHCELLRAGDV